jgi:hypothetical protein
VSPLEARMAHLEGAYEQTTHRLAGFELRFDAIDRKLESIRGELRAELVGGIDSLRRDMNRQFTWTIGLIFPTWATAVVTTLEALARR